MQGKRLPFSEHTIPYRGTAKRCSPLAFSSFFNNPYFIGRYSTEELEGGITTNMENKSIAEFCSVIKQQNHVEQYAIFETNGKFRIPTSYLEEIFDDNPQAGKCYCYFVNIVTNAGFHKQIYIRTKDSVYIIDSHNEFVEQLTMQEFYATGLLSRITNLSVLMNVKEKKFLFGTEGYDCEMFNHLI